MFYVWLLLFSGCDLERFIKQNLFLFTYKMLADLICDIGKELERLSIQNIRYEFHLEKRFFDFKKRRAEFSGRVFACDNIGDCMDATSCQEGKRIINKLKKFIEGITADSPYELAPHYVGPVSGIRIKTKLGISEEDLKKEEQRAKDLFKESSLREYEGP